MRRASRITGLFLVVAILGLAPVAAGTRSAAAWALAPAEVTFSIGDGVTAEDEMLIREGVRVAQDFLADELGVHVREKTIVNARATAPDDAPLIGMTGTRWVGIYTGSEGWLMSSPADRLHVVVHEFVHVMQNNLAGADRPPTPMWLDEGIAEYLAFRAIDRLGLIDLEDADAYLAFAVVYGSWLPGLADLESFEGFQSQDPTVYALAYFAAQALVQGDDLDRVAEYYEAIGDGDEWAMAFADAFRREPAEFYAGFEAVRVGIAAPPAVPQAFWLAAPTEMGAAVEATPLAEPIDRGEQVLITAWTDPGARCGLVVTSAANETVLDRPASADARGLVFWLWTVPPETKRGTAEAELACGADPANERIEIA